MSTDASFKISRPSTTESIPNLTKTDAFTVRRRNGTAISSGRSSPAPPTPDGLEMPKTNHYSAKESIPNTPLAVSVISALLGALAGAALCAAARPVLRFIGADDWVWARPQLGIYLAACGIFHLLEFWTTAGWNYKKLSVDAFLLNNTTQYHLAHAFGLTEYVISSYFFPGKFNTICSSLPVLAAITLLLLVAQSFRSLAMVHASQSFSHIVKHVKLEDHVLITDGVYALSRHPSYAGFFYWALASQLLLSNVVSTLGFVFVLRRFFSFRIRDEEVHLIRFFGDEYLRYRSKVATLLPFRTS